MRFLIDFKADKQPVRTFDQKHFVQQLPSPDSNPRYCEADRDISAGMKQEKVSPGFGRIRKRSHRKLVQP